MASGQNRDRHCNTLRAHLPRAGFRWPPHDSLLRQERQDKTVLEALRDHGGATLLHAGTRTRPRHFRKQVEQILADMLDFATADANAGRIDEFNEPVSWLGDLRTQLRWAQNIEENTFLELFVRLRCARFEWSENPREPFDVDEHGVLAHALDGFHRATSDSLVITLDQIYLMSINPDLSVGTGRAGDDPAAAVPHTQGTSAHAAAGEPHPQMPSALDGAGEDEDGDVQMDEEDSEDGRVRDVRLQLAATDLGEDMEVDE